MGALIFFVVACVLTVVVAGICDAMPSILSFVKSLVNWHKY